MKAFPALDVRVADAEPEPRDLLYAALDDFGPTALEEREDSLRAFFVSADARDRALHALSARCVASAVDVLDEDWARRSQENLPPVTVGRITIATKHQTRSLAAPSTPQ